MKTRLGVIALAGLAFAGCQKENSTDVASPSKNIPVVSVATAEPAELLYLDLKLNAGERFPLIKTVRQFVTQHTGGRELTAETELELSLVLTVAGAEPDFVTFDVLYSRVKFIQDSMGRRAVFDSSAPSKQIPAAALPFSGLAGQSYSIEVGRDHKIRQLIGHDEFLRACVARVPESRRPFLMNEIAVRFGDEGVAGFIPDTIGLLPYDHRVKDPALASRVQQGDTWSYERRLMQPIPVHLKSMCRVVRVSQTRAEIDLAGRVTPGSTYSTSPTDQAQVRILGGTTSGTCIIDRLTGLPIEVRRSEDFNVQVATNDGSEVRQQKNIETTVRMFLPEHGPVVDRDGRAPTDIRQVSGRQDAAQGAVRRIPVKP